MKYNDRLDADHVASVGMARVLRFLVRTNLSLTMKSWPRGSKQSSGWKASLRSMQRTVVETCTF